MKNISILGSTGSIGVSTLEIVAAHPDRFKVTALSAGNNLELLREQIERFSPELVAVIAEESAIKLSRMLTGEKPEILHGVSGMIAVATMAESELVVAAIVGAAGLVPTAAAVKAGKNIALANKETLVTAGHIIMGMVKEKGIDLYPVDSEHSAVYQSIQGHRRKDVKRIILTASGGPFFKLTGEQLAQVTVKDALNHPNWNMGRKITIDSATMMNKGLEVIEARWLFDIHPENISVHIHPQSIIHSMVEYIDGCVMAQLGVPDMKAPIAYALAYPERVETGVQPLDLTTMSGLTFFRPDCSRFPALKLAFKAMKGGESMPAVLNAANEIAVEAFLNGRIGFVDIPAIVEKTMDAHTPQGLATIEEVLLVDRWAREKAHSILNRHQRK